MHLYLLASFQVTEDISTRSNVCFSAGLWLAVCCVSSPLIGCGTVMWYNKKSRDTLRRSKAMIFMRIWLTLKWILPTILELGRKNKIHNRGVDDFCTLLEKVWGRWEGKNLQSSPVSPSPYQWNMFKKYAMLCYYKVELFIFKLTCFLKIPSPQRNIQL